MTNASAIPVTQQSALDLGNPMIAVTAIAVTAILVIGMCYCVTVYANAKYNRDTDLSYGEFHLKSVSSASVSHQPN